MVEPAARAAGDNCSLEAIASPLRTRWRVFLDTHYLINAGRRQRRFAAQQSVCADPRGHMPTYVVVTGIPASGKTTVAARLAAALGAPHLDKDTFLDELLCRAERVSPVRRRELSREADRVLHEKASRQSFAVLSSWWKHPRSESNSGTDISWLTAAGTHAIEVYCMCPAVVAVERFQTRRRHPGHLDSLHTREGLLAQFTQAQALGPLFSAQAMACNTAAPVPEHEIAGLVSSIRQRAMPIGGGALAGESA